MSGYVLVRRDGLYVAPRGSASSYVRDLAKARIFETREAAAIDRCVDNESIRSVSECLDGRKH